MLLLATGVLPNGTFSISCFDVPVPHLESHLVPWTLSPVPCMSGGYGVGLQINAKPGGEELSTICAEFDWHDSMAMIHIQGMRSQPSWLNVRRVQMEANEERTGQ